MEELLLIKEDRYKVPPIAESPWLITTHSHQKRNKLEKQTFRTNTTSYIKTIPELHRKTLVGTHQGWLILRDCANFKIYYLWNPLTSLLIRLPELVLPELEKEKKVVSESEEEEEEEEEDEDDDDDDDDDKLKLPSACVLTSSPDDVDNPDTRCALVLFFNGGLMFSCRPTASRNCSWVKQTLKLNGCSLDIHRAAVLDGVIYAYGYTQTDNFGGQFPRFVLMNIVAHDCSASNYTITLEKPKAIELPTLRIKFPDHREGTYTVDCCGVLYFISIRSWINDASKFMDIINILVWRLDISQMEWIKIDSLKNRAFLIGNGNCTWCWAPTPSIEENCIYILDGSRIYSYNLQDDSYTILSYPSLSSDSTFLEFSCNPIWFTSPNHQRLLSNLEDCSRTNNEKAKDFKERVDSIDETLPGTLLLDLPTEILQLISRNMNLFDCMDLGATCKKLHKADLVAEWRANSSYPLFMARKDNHGTYELLDPFENVTHTISNFDDSLTDLSTFESCKDGWLLLRSNGDHLKFLNPFTRKKFDNCHQYLLPCAGFTFSTNPTSADLEIVGIFGYGQKGQVCIVHFEAGKGVWVWHEMDFNSDTDIPFIPNDRSSPRYHKNAFYFIDNNGSLGVLTGTEGKLIWHVYKSPLTDEDIDSCYLVELDGELVSIFIGDMGNWVRLFKFNKIDKCWVELDTLGDDVVFVSRASSFSVKSKKDEMKNRIYLPRRMGNEIVFYSLDTGKYHTASSAKSMHNFLSMKAQSSCCWIF